MKPSREKRYTKVHYVIKKISCRKPSKQEDSGQLSLKKVLEDKWWKLPFNTSEKLFLNKGEIKIHFLPAIAKEFFRKKEDYSRWKYEFSSLFSKCWPLSRNKNKEVNVDYVWKQLQKGWERKETEVNYYKVLMIYIYTWYNTWHFKVDCS